MNIALSLVIRKARSGAFRNSRGSSAEHDHVGNASKFGHWPTDRASRRQLGDQVLLIVRSEAPGSKSETRS
jgi:hypothetical protein